MLAEAMQNFRRKSCVLRAVSIREQFAYIRVILRQISIRDGIRRDNRDINVHKLVVADVVEAEPTVVVRQNRVNLRPRSSFPL